MATVTLMKRLGFVVGLGFLLTEPAQAARRTPIREWGAQSTLLQQELDRLHSVARSGGWGRIQTQHKFLQTGESDPAVLQLKYRLFRSGDLPVNDGTKVYTEEVAGAVKNVQRRFGQTQNGVLDAALIRQLNVPVEKRIAQLNANLRRLENLRPRTTGTWIVANIPEYRLHVFENNRHIFDMNIVVGSIDNKTVLFHDEMQYLVFSPYWNVPPSIVRGEILPAARRDKAYLRNNGYEKMGVEDGLPKIRQKPGRGNSLGLVKFVFPNSHNIYFHDTPAKSLFELKKRAFSHGCIRLAEPAKLAEYLLRDQPEWTPEKIRKAMESGREQRVDLPQSVPVSITYFTAWVDEDGLLNFRDDVYGLDR